ncbi:EF-P 5-aminopentanol modification-associated protein YfmF [Weissella hellenica]|uniref:Insulinase family protein n=1 Tax=Weissella hellenica TaxID=46256 RepID=A0A4Y4G636_WEIHE|nr:insulinase family protein [Weissella hellenica]NKY67327.1 insulinase family protein [Weissella hellenica]GED36305.1 peptidase M16 [Weissella hellenica]SCC01980.1 Predicted Zn-dependent peptidase [Weissella hellenica]
MFTKEIQQGVFVHVLPTQQFATTHIAVNFTQQLNKKTLNERVLAGNMLETASKKYDSQTKLTQVLNEMMGAAFGVEVFKIGQLHTIRLQLNLVHDSFVTTGKSLLNEGFDFLNEVINAPMGNFDEGFTPVIFDRQKEVALDEIAGLKEDKPFYALRQALDTYYGPSIQATPAFGSAKGLANVTAQTAWQIWQESVAKDRIDIVVVGDVDQVQVTQLAQMMKFTARDNALSAYYHQPLLPRVNQIKVVDDVVQARLVLGYALPAAADEYFIATVFNGIFGSLANSRLLLNVREKSGLVYGISSDYNPYTDLLLVEAGVDQANLSLTVKKVNAELQRLQQVLVPAEELTIAKELIKNTYTMTLDQPLYLADRVYNQQLLQRIMSDDDYLRRIDAVTATQIRDFAQKATWQLHYEMVGGIADEQ